MQRSLIERELVQLDLDVADQTAFFDAVVPDLVRRGYVKDAYRQALSDREAKFPTALPTMPEAIAIPHADVEHIIKPFIAPIRLKNPIDWHEMGNNEAVDRVRFIFVLGFTHGDGHVKLLQVLLNNVQDEQFMQGLAGATTPDEYYSIVHAMRGLED